MAISINFLANTREFLKGTSDVESSLADVSDALDDVARDSARSASRMADEQKDAAREVERSNDRLERSFRELADEQRRSTSQMGDGLGDNMRRGTREASESVDEFRGEFKQNMAETFSSFRGDASDFAQIFQDTLGGLAGGLQGIPAVAAVAVGAAGLGAVLGAIEKGNAETEEWKAAVSELAQELIDAGGDSTTAGVQRAVDKLKSLATATDDVKLTELKAEAEAANVSFEKLARTWGGSEKDLRELWRQVDGANDSLWEQIRAAQDRGDANLEEQLRGEARATLELRQQIGQQIGVTHEATDAYKAYVEAGGPQLEAKAQALQSFADSVSSSLADAGSAWEDYNKDGTTSLDEYNAHIEEQIASITAYQQNVTTISGQLSQDALNYILSLGTDAAPIIQAFVDAPLAQQQRTAANWDSLGKQSSSAYKNSLQNDLTNSVVAGPRVVINDVDTSRIPRMIQQTLDGHRFEVPVYANPRVGRAVS